MLLREAGRQPCSIQLQRQVKQLQRHKPTEIREAPELMVELVYLTK